MPYQSPSPTFREFKKTLASGYGVIFTPRVVAPKTKGEFQALHLKRIVGAKEYESMTKDRPDDERITWYELDSICRNLHIDPDHDGLFGVISFRR